MKEKVKKIAKEIIAMTAKNEMLKCNKCRNVARIMRPGAGNLVCCGEPMKELSNY